MIVSELLCYLILSVGLRICGDMLGIGGDLIAIPVLSLLFHMDQLLAQGTALIIVTPNVLIGFLRDCQRNHIDLRQTFKLCLFATQVALAMPVEGLQKAFAAQRDIDPTDPAAVTSILCPSSGDRASSALPLHRPWAAFADLDDHVQDAPTLKYIITNKLK